MLSQLDRHEAPASLPIEPAISLTPTIIEGFLGRLGLEVHRSATQWSLAPQLAEANESQFSRAHQPLRRLRCGTDPSAEARPNSPVLCLSVRSTTSVIRRRCLSITVRRHASHLTELEEVTGDGRMSSRTSATPSAQLMCGN